MMAAPFKFDVPSPDDVVMNGMRASKLGSKGILQLYLSLILWLRVGISCFSWLYFFQFSCTTPLVYW